MLAFNTSTSLFLTSLAFKYLHRAQFTLRHRLPYCLADRVPIEAKNHDSKVERSSVKQLMSLGVFSLFGPNRRPSIKLNTKQQRTERYLQSYALQAGLTSFKYRPNRIHIRRASLVASQENLVLPTQVQHRRALSLLPQHCIEQSVPMLSKPSSVRKLSVKQKTKSRTQSQAVLEARPKYLGPSKALTHKPKLNKFEVVDALPSKTTRSTFVSTNPEDSLLSLLEALENL